jgi:hypothetical protein
MNAMDALLSWKWFAIGSVCGCLCIATGAAFSLPVHLLGLALLLPGSALAAYATPVSLMHRYLGTMPVSDVLYLPVVVVTNAVVFAAVRRFCRPYRTEPPSTAGR